MAIVLTGLLLLSGCQTSQGVGGSGSPPASPAPADPYSVPQPTLFVSPSGSDSNEGTSWSQAFATIQQAASVAKPGDAIAVGPGSYAGGIVTRASGSPGSRIVFYSATPLAAKIDGTGYYTAWQNNGSYVDIVGFDVSGSTYLGIVNSGSFVRVISNEVHDLAVPSCNGPNGGAGIDQANYQAEGDETLGNIVHDIVPPGSYCGLIQGIYHSNKGGVIANNIVYHVSAVGIQTWHAATAVTISNNLVFDNHVGIVVAGDTVVGDNYLVTNNIVMDNVYGIVENGTQLGGNNRYIDNLLWHNGSGFDLINGSASGTVSADPQLVEFKLGGGGDYQLSATSPAIDAGTSAGAPAYDIAAVPRPQLDGIDIGPYEYRPPVQTAATPGGAAAR